jgi:hypothetical protein
VIEQPRGEHELNELMEYAADPGELERVAGELNVTSADLEMLGAAGFAERERVVVHAHGAGHIDELALWRAEPALLRDMERVCSFCANKRRCHQELAAGTAATKNVEYCENSDTMDTLRFKS